MVIRATDKGSPPEYADLNITLRVQNVNEDFTLTTTGVSDIGKLGCDVL